MKLPTVLRSPVTYPQPTIIVLPNAIPEAISVSFAILRRAVGVVTGLGSGVDSRAVVVRVLAAVRVFCPPFVAPTGYQWRFPRG
jgi:hypothetical protein